MERKGGSWHTIFDRIISSGLYETGYCVALIDAFSLKEKDFEDKK